MSLVFRARDSVTGQAKAVTAADAGTALTDLVPDNTARNAAAAAQTAADNAQGTADAGVSDAANAQSTADGAQTAANTAQGAADAALFRLYTAYTENIVAAGTGGAGPLSIAGIYLNVIDTINAGVDEDVMLSPASSRGQEQAVVNVTASPLYVWGDGGNASTDTLLGSTFPVTVPANSMKQFLCVALGVWAVN
jgi:hypothetical protein